MKIKHKLRNLTILGVGITTLAVLLSACSTTEGPGKDLSKWYNDGMEKIKQSNGAVEDLPLSKSGLVGIFKPTNAEQSWPRVALSIESVSPQIFSKVNGSINFKETYVRKSCLTVSAVVWQSKKVSSRIAPIEACVDQMTRFKDVETRVFAMGDYPVLDWALGYCREDDCLDSNISRNGPSYPAKTIPTGEKYADLFMGRSTFILSLDLLLQIMGADVKSIDLQKDHRVWIVKMPLEAPAGERGKTNIKIF